MTKHKVYNVTTERATWAIIAATLAEAEYRFTLAPINGNIVDIKSISRMPYEVYNI